MALAPADGLLIDRTPHPCPYLEGRVAVLPTRWYPRIEPDRFDQLLAASDRRVGRTLYRPACPACTACQAIRIPLADFRMRRSQRRVWRRNQDLRVTVGPPRVDAERLTLFNRHKLERGLADRPTTARAYQEWLVTSCVRTVETRYHLGDRLVAVGILDLGRRAASSVYFYFDPDLSRRGLGTFSVLAECAWLRRQGLDWYYLGLYVRDCPQLAYKARFTPHERLVDGSWRRFEEPEPAPG